MTVERRVELANRIIEIGKQLKFESGIALVAHDLKKLAYINQEAIVLKKITECLACMELSSEGNEED